MKDGSGTFDFGENIVGFGRPGKSFRMGIVMVNITLVQERF
jgi:hypothetical protein